jgi:hypothetical protein
MNVCQGSQVERIAVGRADLRLAASGGPSCRFAGRSIKRKPAAVCPLNVSRPRIAKSATAARRPHVPLPPDAIAMMFRPHCFKAEPNFIGTRSQGTGDIPQPPARQEKAAQ